MNDQWRQLALKYAAIITDLFDLNKKLLSLLAQHTSVDEYEKELVDVEKKITGDRLR